MSTPHVSPELLQAQTAAFVAEYPLDDGSAPTLPQRLADVALGISDSVELNQSQEETMTGFLMKVGSDYAPIARRERLLQAYERFAPVVDPLVDELFAAGLEDWAEHPAYLDEGYRCAVFSIEGDEQDYAVRVPWPPGTPDKDKRFGGIDKEYVRAGIRAMGVANLEQITAFSFGSNVVISEKMLGDNFLNIGPDALEQVTQNQVVEFVDTLEYVHVAGLSIDPRLPNFFYDPEKGFGFIDLAVRKYAFNKTRSPYAPTEKEVMSSFLAYGALMLHEIGLRPMHVPEDKDEFEKNKRMAEAALGLLKVYKSICDERFNEEIVQLTLSIQKAEHEVAGYSKYAPV
ncbi:MAG TPA: hypothetical protein VFX86_01345 [Candidatus Saccharimonadales bacterium]|nr:hypothetical protein [Candidatus Saccharimonadales bacterium]